MLLGKIQKVSVILVLALGVSLAPAAPVLASPAQPAAGGILSLDLDELFAWAKAAWESFLASTPSQPETGDGLDSAIEKSTQPQSSGGTTSFGGGGGGNQNQTNGGGSGSGGETGSGFDPIGG